MNINSQTVMIYEAITQCFNRDNELSSHIELSEFDETFFYSSVLALQLIYHTLTNEKEVDVIDFIGILNKITFQCLMDNKGEQE